MRKGAVTMIQTNARRFHAGKCGGSVEEGQIGSGELTHLFFRCLRCRVILHRYQIGIAFEPAGALLDVVAVVPE